jgi:[ribosomal protein S5]-alanine N-acetyltransferase
MRSSRGYPVILTEGPISLRPPRPRDGRQWQELQTRNRAWLSRWEATVPPNTPYARRLTYRELVHRGRREAAAGRMLPFNVWYDAPELPGPARMVGQLNVAGITWGSLCSAHIGYWVDERVAGRGIIPGSLALAVDYCFLRLGLHRIEVNVRPENGPSRRVAEKLGFRDEGVRKEFLHIDGAWRDHVSYAITAGEVPEGMIIRWRTLQIV